MDASITSVVETINDVTETRKLQGQLVPSQKIAPIARLTVGVTHDFNNIQNEKKALAGLLGQIPAAENAILTISGLVMVGLVLSGQAPNVSASAVYQGATALVSTPAAGSLSFTAPLAEASRPPSVYREAPLFQLIGIHLPPLNHGVVKPDFHNVPSLMFSSANYPQPAPTNPCQYFIQQTVAEPSKRAKGNADETNP